MNAPPGYVLVPVEPTQEMLDASWKSHDDRWDRIRLYKAMLAAAPKVQSVPLLTDEEIDAYEFACVKDDGELDVQLFARAIERRVRRET